MSDGMHVCGGHPYHEIIEESYYQPRVEQGHRLDCAKNGCVERHSDDGRVFEWNDHYGECPREGYIVNNHATTYVERTLTPWGEPQLDTRAISGDPESLAPITAGTTSETFETAGGFAFTDAIALALNKKWRSNGRGPVVVSLSDLAWLLDGYARARQLDGTADGRKTCPGPCGHPTYCAENGCQWGPTQLDGSADDPMAEAADWLVEVGYPFDFRTDPLPPLHLRTAVEEAWVRRDGPYDADGIRETCAEEGGWLDGTADMGGAVSKPNRGDQ